MIGSQRPIQSNLWQFIADLFRPESFLLAEIDVDRYVIQLQNSWSQTMAQQEKNTIQPETSQS